MSHNYPGMVQPETKGMISGSPSQSAYVTTQNNANTAQSLKNAVGGARSKSCKNKRGGAVNVPQYNMQYNVQNARGPNDQITSNSKTSMQGSANSVYDNNAKNMPQQKGGSTSSNLGWKCMSGGCCGGCMNGGKTYKKKKKLSHKKKKKNTRSHKKRNNKRNKRKSRKSRKYRKR
jgi:hypothetical protein